MKINRVRIRCHFFAATMCEGQVVDIETKQVLHATRSFPDSYSERACDEARKFAERQGWEITV